MKDLFKNLFNSTQCQRNGICSTNPIIHALEVVIINEIRQIAFYIVKLKELNFTNNDIMQKCVLALSTTISDINFNEKSLLSFYSNLKEINKNIKIFYTDKSKELKISYEFVSHSYAEKNEEKNITGLIKSGENIIREFYNTMNEEKIRLINLIVLICRVTSINLVKLSEYKKPESDYYYEILRLLSLINHKTTREEKFIRRIKEFSKIIYKIQDELNFELTKAYGKRREGEVTTDIYKGRSILITGGDLDEFYNLLEKTKDEEINVYINSSMLSSIFYPKFHEFKNFKGLYGTNDVEFDFSNFKGAIYTTRNSTRGLDSAFRGTIYSTKLISQDRTIKLDKNNLSPLIEEAKKIEGFENSIKGFEIDFEYNLEKINKIIETNQEKKFLLCVGFVDDAVKNKFSDYVIINLLFPYETEGIYYVSEKISSENLTVYFSQCFEEIVNTIMSLVDKNIEIYISNCISSNINPHIIESIKKDFGIKVI